MEDIRIYKKIELDNPVMIAGWPGMGSVALGMVDYLRRKLKAARFAEIKIDPMSMLDAVEVENGISKLPTPPSSAFYYTRNPDIVLFEGEVQLAGIEGLRLLNKVLDVAGELRVKRIYTGAAFPLPIGFKENPELYGVVNKDHLRDIVTKSGIKLMERGHISGLNGLLLGFAAKRNIEAMCILATMPQYAISLPNPKASGAIIEILCGMLGIQIDLNELRDYVKDMEERMAIIEDKVKDVFTIEEEAPESHPHEKKIPGYIMEKIEKLFIEAKNDKTKASTLKKELDRWDLYKLYEDRFLDLFKNNQ
jgi:proteasome assembly chaperone (PAC2) family protein